MNIVLVSDGSDWVSAARLPKPLKAAGFTVTVCCPAGGLVTASRFIDRRVDLPRPVSCDSLRTALREIQRLWGIDFVIPGDDAVLSLLHRLVLAAPEHADGTDQALIATLAASLGTPAKYADIVRKSYFASSPDIPGCRTPAQAVIDHTTNVFAVAERLGYPVMIKRDFMSGGTGVYAIADRDSLERFVAANNVFVQAAPGDVRLHRGHYGILQKRIDGTDASVSLVAREGRMLAAFAYRKRLGRPTGPTSVAEPVERADLPAIARTVVEHFGFTGLGGVDVVIEAGTDQPYLLEFNARPPITCHLGPLLGADLCGTLFAALAGTPPPSPTPPLVPAVALFPGEWDRDGSSLCLHTLFHDVPWDDTPLLKALVARKAA